MDLMTMLAERRAVQRLSALRALGLGVSSLAAVPVATEAKGKGGKGRRKAKDRCPGQVATCDAAFTSYCDGRLFEAECLSAAQACCASLKTCDAASAMDCFILHFLVA